MCHCVEARACMVGAHAAGADAAERQVARGEVHQRVVDGHAAGEHLRQDRVDGPPIVAEGVQRQRTIAREHTRDRLVDGVERQDRQDRAEDLVSHHRGVVAGLQHQRRYDQMLGLGTRRVDVEQRNHFQTARARIVQVAAQARPLPGVDDPRKVRRRAVKRAVARRRLRAQCGDQRIAVRVVHQHIVRRDAGLAAVEPLAGRQPRRRLVDREIRSDDRWGLATELQRQRGEVGCGRGHHLAADRGRPGEHQVVERQRRECRADVGVAERHRDAVGREYRRQQGLQPGAGARRVLGRLQVDVVAGGDRGGEGDQRQVDRIVPRRHHADHADRHRQQLRARRPQLPADAHAARPHPAPEVRAQVVDLRQHRHGVGHERLVRGAVAEVGGDRGDHILAAGMHGVAEAREVGATLRGVGTSPSPRPAQRVEGGLEIGVRGVGVHGGQCRHGGRTRRGGVAAAARITP